MATLKNSKKDLVATPLFWVVVTVVTVVLVFSAIYAGMAYSVYHSVRDIQKTVENININAENIGVTEIAMVSPQEMTEKAISDEETETVEITPTLTLIPTETLVTPTETPTELPTIPTEIPTSTGMILTSFGEDTLALAEFYSTAFSETACTVLGLTATDATVNTYPVIYVPIEAGITDMSDMGMVRLPWEIRSRFICLGSFTTLPVTDESFDLLAHVKVYGSGSYSYSEYRVFSMEEGFFPEEFRGNHTWDADPDMVMKFYHFLKSHNLSGNVGVGGLVPISFWSIPRDENIGIEVVEVQ